VGVAVLRRNPNFSNPANAQEVLAADESEIAAKLAQVAHGFVSGLGSALGFHAVE
jgi:hypothetical protein